MYNIETRKLETLHDQETLVKVQNMKTELEQLNASKAAGSFIRSKAAWVEENEYSSTYFLNTERRNYKMKHIKKHNVSETNSITDPKEILAEEVKFYSNLYKVDEQINNHDTNFFKTNIPKLNNK